MADQHGTISREQVEEFVEFIKNPLPEIVPNWERLTPRMRRVMHMYVIQGMGYESIAYELSIVIQTVKNHVWLAGGITGTTNSIIKDDLIEEIRRRADELIESS